MTTRMGGSAAHASPCIPSLSIRDACISTHPPPPPPALPYSPHPASAAGPGAPKSGEVTTRMHGSAAQISPRNPSLVHLAQYLQLGRLQGLHIQEGSQRECCVITETMWGISRIHRHLPAPFQAAVTKADTAFKECGQTSLLHEQTAGIPSMLHGLS